MDQIDGVVVVEVDEAELSLRLVFIWNSWENIEFKITKAFYTFQVVKVQLDIATSSKLGEVLERDPFDLFHSNC